jgi:DNA primase
MAPKNVTYSDLVRNIDIQKELEKRGFTGFISNGNFMVKCPFHSSKRKTAGLGILLEGRSKGMWRCLSMNCQEKGTFFKLLAEIEGITYKQAEKLFKAGYKKISLKSMKDNFLKGIKNKSKKVKIKYFKKKILDTYEKPSGEYLEYLKGSKRKLNTKSIKKFNILSCVKGKWKDRVIIPIYDDEKDKLVSLVARHITTEDPGKKVRKLKGSDRSKVLFGFNHIKNKEHIVIVEGEFDVIYLQQYNIPAVSLGTTSISSIQKKKIVKSCTKVFLSLDGDVKPEKIRKLRDQINKSVSVEIIKLPKSKDPNNLTKNEIKKLYKNV